MAAGGDAENPSCCVEPFRYPVMTPTTNHVLKATFKISNTGPRSSPVAGRCVVVLNSEHMNSDDWLALPDGAMSRRQASHGEGADLSKYPDL